MNDNISDLYVDYLLSSFGSVTATGLSDVVDGLISHDKITMMLSRKPGTSADLRSVAKPLIRQSENPDGVPITDDSISEKPPTDENDIICRHHDRCKGISVKGISFMTALYYVRDIALPVSFRLIAETEYHINPKDGKEKRRCPVPKNQYRRGMIKQAVTDQIRFGYVLTDVRSASAENMMFIRHEVNKDSVMPVKTDRDIAMKKMNFCGIMMINDGVSMSEPVRLISEQIHRKKFFLKMLIFLCF